ncbi:hypothetical protein GGF46_004858 [Coemansia sp. RSA 552]|nr:hypothetical protein GGF46_004858 [Coemansia sp. RSA 552]
MLSRFVSRGCGSGGVFRHCLSGLRPYSSGRIYRPDGTSSCVREELTPLGRHIRDMILATGPISVAKFMQLALTSPVGGYYTQGKDVFGRSGDFVTSPEISQMFGEIMAVWYVLHWEILGRPAKTALVELGPGKGTLMDDMLRSARRFPNFLATVQEVHLVERSPELRRVQHAKLGCEWTRTQTTGDKNDQDKTPVSSTTRNGVRVYWHDMLEEVEMYDGCVPLVMAHEFFDALPIYRFEKGHNNMWHEILVDVAGDASTDPSRNISLGSTTKDSETVEDSLNFKYVRSREVTANAALLLRDKRFETRFDKGDLIEVSPESARIMSQLADLISHGGGAGLVIDYGQDWTQGDTFRGIKHHKFAHPLGSPGSMDLTADVDFSFLRLAAKDKAQCYGPVEQGSFLHAMGIQARLQQLLQSTRDAKMQKNLVDCYKRLTDPHSMGRIYKVLSVLPKSSACVPVPFAPTPQEELNKPKVEKIVK